MEFIESLYSVALPVHIGAVFTTLAIVLSSDIYGVLWIFGKKETLQRVVIHRLHTVVWIGLFLIIGSGLLLFLPYQEYLLSDFAFRLKMLFVAFLFINAFVINTHMNIASTRSFNSLSVRERGTLLVSGSVSAAGWIGSFIAAQFIGL